MWQDALHGSPLHRVGGKWPREEHGVDTDALAAYNHVDEDGRRVAAEAGRRGYRVGGAFHP